MSKIMEPNIPYIANTILTDIPVNYKIFNSWKYLVGQSNTRCKYPNLKFIPLPELDPSRSWKYPLGPECWSLSSSLSSFHYSCEKLAFYSGLNGKTEERVFCQSPRQTVHSHSAQGKCNSLKLCYQPSGAKTKGRHLLLLLLQKSTKSKNP